MRSARMLLAALAIAALAACGTNPTAPEAVAPSQPRLDGDPATCSGTVVTTVTANGVVTQCVLEGQMGSGVGH